MNVVEPSLQDIHKSSTQLRQQMVDISRHAFRRSRWRGSAQRFLVLVDEDCTGNISLKQAWDFPALQASLLSSYTSSGDYTLPCSTSQIVPRSTLSSPSAYVAVSYCLNRDNQWSWESADEALEVHCEDLSRRRSTTPVDVICRSIAFAIAHNVNAVWIDQECINQSDPIDLKTNMQEMDLVYHESDHAIAVLDFEFQSQAELDVFASVCDDGFFTFDPNQIEELEQVLLGLRDDKWFERAWTLQESVSAGVSMILLLGCPGLEKPACFGSTLRELEISIWDFQNAMVNVRNYVEEGLGAGIWLDDSCAISVSNCADILWNYIPTIVPDWTSELKKHSSHRQICNAAEALTFLDDRFNSVFPDRLAILANLCSYECRIDTSVLEAPRSSFVTCALTQAILNGDMSLLGGYTDGKENSTNGREIPTRELDTAKDARSNELVYVNDDTDNELNTFGFSWGPRPSAALNNISYLEEHHKRFRLKPATLSMQGLRVQGILWHVSCAIPVPNTKRLFVSKWKEEETLEKGETPVQGLARQYSLFRQFIWQLICELILSDMVDMAKTFWNFVQPLGRSAIVRSHDSLSAPIPYAFETILDLERLDSSIEDDIRSRLQPGPLSIDPLNNIGSSIERLLIEQVCSEGALLCASPVESSMGIQLPSSAQPYTWFEACKFGDKIFTPATDLGDEVARSRYRSQAMSWRVLETGRRGDEDCEILHCMGRRRGIWRVEELRTKDYILD